MSTITENTKNGKAVAFKFPAHVGRDEKGKQHFCTTTWKPPAGMSYAKARKMAEADAYKWEQELLRGEDNLHSFCNLFHKENAVFVVDFPSLYCIYYNNISSMYNLNYSSRVFTIISRRFNHKANRSDVFLQA